MATTKRILQVLSEMAKQDKERNENRIMITAPLRNELKTHHQLSMMPELREKRTKMKAQTKAEEDSAYAQYLIEHPKLFEKIVLEEYAKEQLKKKQETKPAGQQVISSFPRVVKILPTVKSAPKTQTAPMVSPRVDVINSSFKDLVDAVQTVDARTPSVARRIFERSKDAGDDEKDEEDDDEEATGEKITNPKMLTKSVVYTGPISEAQKKQADSVVEHYVKDERITNDYSQNLATLRTLRRHLDLPVRQSAALALTEKASTISGKPAVGIPPRVAMKLGIGPR